YFKPNQELRDGLEFVDRTGGSNPLTLVVSAANGSRLNTDEAYKKMWTLHGALEHEKDVGTVTSLPTLVAEGDRVPFSFLISYEKMMEIMSQPKYARVSKSFVTDDRKEAVFMLRMIEARRTKYRVDVVDDLRAVCRKYGFKADLVGGIYYLQGRLAKLVAESLVTGLFWLNLLFIVITWVFAREEQWRGIVYSDVIIAAGFAIFVLSDFPPTQRFGLVVLAGCVIDILANLFVLPLLGGAQLKKRD